MLSVSEATREPATKCVRVLEEPTVNTNNGPLAAAECAMDRRAALLPLAKAKETFTLQLSSCLTAFHKMCVKQKQTACIKSENECVPKSARVAFELTALKEVRDSAEFLELKQTMDTSAMTFKTACCTATIGAMKLETMHLHNEHEAQFVLTLCRIIDTMLMMNTRLNVSDTDVIAVAIVNQHCNQIGRQFAGNKDQMIALCEDTNSIGAMWEPLAILNADMDPNDFAADVQQQEAALPENCHQEAIIPGALEHIDGLTMQPIDICVDTHAEKELALKLSKLATKCAGMKSNNDTEMVMNAKSPANQATIEELIRKEGARLSDEQKTNQNWKGKSNANQSNFDEKEAASAKNNRWGSGKSTTQKKSNANAQAAKSNNDSHKGKQNNNNKRSQKQSKKK